MTKQFVEQKDPEEPIWSVLTNQQLHDYSEVFAFPNQWNKESHPSIDITKRVQLANFWKLTAKPGIFIGRRLHKKKVFLDSRTKRLRLASPRDHCFQSLGGRLSQLRPTMKNVSATLCNHNPVQIHILWLCLTFPKTVHVRWPTFPHGKSETGKSVWIKLILEILGKVGELLRDLPTSLQRRLSTS